jgi:hypothetical protein
MTALPPRPEMEKTKQRRCHHIALKMFAGAHGNSGENAKNNSQYARVRGPSDGDQPLRSRLIELKLNEGREFLLDQNWMQGLDLEN